MNIYKIAKTLLGVRTYALTTFCLTFLIVANVAVDDRETTTEHGDEPVRARTRQGAQVATAGPTGAHDADPPPQVTRAEVIATGQRGRRPPTPGVEIAVPPVELGRPQVPSVGTGRSDRRAYRARATG